MENTGVFTVRFAEPVDPAMDDRDPGDMTSPESPEPADLRSSWLMNLLPIMAMAAAALFLFSDPGRPAAVLMGALVAASAVAMFVSTAVIARLQAQEQREVRLREAEDDLEEVLRRPVDPDSGELTQHLALPGLWAVTHRRLDHYHGIALNQASRSFRNAQIAMVLGFVLLAAFVMLALRASTTAGSVVAGALGAIAAGLSGYVSRTFIRSQETAAAHLRSYFEQPLEFSRYLAAERLIADAGLSEERRAEVLAALVEAMAGKRVQDEGGGDGNSDRRAS